jgi:hypothetical protein
MITEFRLMTIHDEGDENDDQGGLYLQVQLGESLVPSATAWAATTWATAATRTAIASCIR